MASFSTPVICQAFIGRASERDALYRLIERTQSGQGQVALVCGDAGVGKSRLLAEAKSRAAAQGFLLLQGNCFQMDSSYPYAPLLDMLRAFVSQSSLATGEGSSVLEFARLLPELALSLTVPLPASLPDPEQEKRRLFAALTRFFKEQASQQPVLLVIEDLHWCDDISLEFLQSLARLCITQPLLLLMTYRSDEVQPGLQRFLAQLDRARLSQELQLKPFSSSDVDAMLGAMFTLNEAEQDDLLALIYPLTEGNPFFVEEVLTSLVSHGELLSDDGVWQRKPHSDHVSDPLPVPRSVQDAVQQRTQRLSAAAMQAVTFAAVAGRRFDFAVLQQVMHCDEEHLLLLMKELVAAQLVAEVSADQFAFRHALTQQAVYTGLLARERRSLHLAVAQAIEQLYTPTPVLDAHLEDLAYHYYEAGTWSKALEYEQRVGEKALALYAPHAAVDHFTHALFALQHLSGAQQFSPVYRLRGQAYETLGEFERARGDYERALETARGVQDRLMQWQCMLSLGFLWTGHDYERAGVWFHMALALAEELDDSKLRATSLNRLGNWLQNTGRISEALEAHQEALRLFEMRADKQGMAETLGELGMASFFTGNPDRAVNDFFKRVIALFRSLGDSQGLFSALAARAIDAAPEAIEPTYSALLTRNECVQDAEEALLLARQTNSQAGQAFAEMALTWVLSSFGEFGPARVHAQEALRIATSIEHQEWIAATNGALGQLYLLLLEAGTAVSYLEAGVAGAQALGSMIWIGYLMPYLAMAYILNREFPRAEATLKTIIPRDREPGNFFERQAARIWGELALAQGDAVRALNIAEQLIVSAPGDIQQPIPHLLALKGEALLALKRLEEAAGALEDAKLGAQQRQAPSILWRIHRSLGRVYHLLKREDLAQLQFASAREIINSLAVTIDDTALREHFLQTALSSLPPAKTHSAEALTSSQYGGLSAREREVAALVAQGRTNREIADSLIVSERTAEAHVSNILGKLGFSTRAQIAVWAVEKGLTTTH